MGVVLTRLFESHPQYIYNIKTLPFKNELETKTNQKLIKIKDKSSEYIIKHEEIENNEKYLNIPESLVSNVNKIKLNEKIEMTHFKNEDDNKKQNNDENLTLNDKELFTMLQDETYARYLIETKKIPFDTLKNTLNYVSVDKIKKTK